MKRFKVYRNIRKRALIYGLPITLFALMMLSILGSLLVIIFSFSLTLVVLAALLNLALYWFLTRFSVNPQLLNFSKGFPQYISNKKTSDLKYEN